MQEGHDQELVFRNPRKPSLLVEKIDQNHPEKKLAGAVIRISVEDSAEYTEVTTGSDGTALLEDLPETWLTVWEVTAPDGYLLSDKKQIVEVVAGKVSKLVLENSQNPSLTIRKVDEQTGDGLAAVTLRVTRDGVQDITTGPDGLAQIDNLEPGWVTVTGIRTLDSHILDSTPHVIELKTGENAQLVVKNRAKPSLEILKTDKLTGQPIEGAKFNVCIKNGKNLGDFLTGPDGQILLKDIGPALYVITELFCEGYHLLAESIEVLVGWGKKTTVPLENQPENPLLIYKVNVEMGDLVAGAKFSVTRVDGSFIGEYRTGRNGYCIVLGQKPGFFVVKEIEAAPGYILDETPKTVELKKDSLAVVEFENKPLNGIRIYKYDSTDTGKGLEGSKFRITQKGGKLVGEYRTGPRGELVVDGLVTGWYTVTEIEPPSPEYLLDSRPRDVELKWNDYMNLEWPNTKYSGLQLLKVDSVTGKRRRRSGARFLPSV